MVYIVVEYEKDVQIKILDVDDTCCLYRIDVGINLVFTDNIFRWNL